MRDLVLGNTHKTRPAPTRHIDHIWVLRGIGSTVGLQAQCQGTCQDGSDHCWTRGRWIT